MKYIFNIFKEFKYPLLLIYLYVFLAQMLFLVEPYILGKMIDGLIVHQYKWLYIFLTTCIVANVFMYRRMVYDTKVFTDIYNTVTFRYLKEDNKSGASTKIARTELTHNVINFFENDAHFYIYALLSVVGSLFFIIFEDIATGFTVAACIIPIVFIVKFLYKKIAQSTVIGNNHYEQKINILNSNDEEQISTFFKRRKKILVCGSTLQGKNWFALNSTKSVFLVLALLVFTRDNNNMTQGQTVAMYAYINQFLIALMSIPIAVETYARIKDTINRIKEPLNN